MLDGAFACWPQVTIRGLYCMQFSALLPALKKAESIAESAFLLRSIRLGIKASAGSRLFILSIKHLMIDAYNY